MIIISGVSVLAIAVWKFGPGLSNALELGPPAVLSHIGLSESATSAFPTNEYDRIELERIEVHKRVAAAILGASDVAAMDRAAKVVEQGSRDLKDLVDRRKLAGGSKKDIRDAEFKYLNARRNIAGSTSTHTSSLAKRGIQSPALQWAESDFRSAEQELQLEAMPALPTIDSLRDVRRNVNRPAAHGEVVIRIGAGIYMTEPASRQPGPLPAGEFGKAKENYDAALSKIRDAQTEAFNRLAELAGTKNKSTSQIGVQAHLRMSYAGSVEALAKEIDFARVDSVDEGARVILITLDREILKTAGTAQ